MIAIILTCTNVFAHQKRLPPIERQTSDSEPFLHIIKGRFYLQYHAIRAPALTAEGCSYFCTHFCERSNQRKPAVQQRAGRMSAGFTWSGSETIVQRIQPVQTSSNASKSTRKMRWVNMVTTSFVLMMIVSHIFPDGASKGLCQALYKCFDKQKTTTFTVESGRRSDLLACKKHVFANEKQHPGEGSNTDERLPEPVHAKEGVAPEHIGSQSEAEHRQPPPGEM